MSSFFSFFFIFFIFFFFIIFFFLLSSLYYSSLSSCSVSVSTWRRAKPQKIIHQKLGPLSRCPFPTLKYVFSSDPVESKQRFTETESPKSVCTTEPRNAKGRHIHPVNDFALTRPTQNDPPTGKRTKHLFCHCYFGNCCTRQLVFPRLGKGIPR